MALEYGALDVQNHAGALGESWMSLHCAIGVSLFTWHKLPFAFLFHFSRHEQHQHMTASWAVVACDMHALLTATTFDSVLQALAAAYH